jgi:hypothetical protein
MAKPNWELHKFCPICKEKATGGARDFEGTNFCANGHTWFLCLVDHKTVTGGMPFVNRAHGYRQKVVGDPFKICQCNETAFERLEI